MLAVLFMLMVCAFPSSAQQRSVAITFDDLPAAGTTDPTEARSLNISILDSLDRHHAPAIGFVIESRVQEIGNAQGLELLGQWVGRGYELGNHTKHDAIAAFLQHRGYTLAVCTIDTEDFVFNEAYLKMLANKDEASASRLRTDYLAYTSAEIDYYSGLHGKIFGREIPHVMLLHINRLNADVIDKLLDIFAQKKYAFVSLDEALSDAAYKTPDAFITKNGWMWAYRWARELGVQVNGAIETEPPAWIAQYGKDKQK
jgi:peptidoglycan/xylan/chitin deacetylase (PgdA/CDA1 family)